VVITVVHETDLIYVLLLGTSSIMHAAAATCQPCVLVGTIQ
jgi:hypothetical protein